MGIQGKGPGKTQAVSTPKQNGSGKGDRSEPAAQLSPLPNCGAPALHFFPALPQDWQVAEDCLCYYSEGVSKNCVGECQPR